MPSEASSSNGSRDHIQQAANGATTDSKTYPMVDIENASQQTGSERPARAVESSEGTTSTGSSRSDFERLPLFAQKAARKVQSSPPGTVAGRIWTWLKGPVPPRRYHINPFFEKFQLAPVRFLDAILPGRRRKLLCLLAFYILWMALFVHILRDANILNTSAQAGVPIRLNCVNRLWTDGPTCGINGEGCRPFDNNTWIFRCPGSCSSAQVLNPYAVGDQEVVYQPLVIGGPSETDENEFVYRGDSFICGAAIHAGIIDDRTGGLGLISMTGEKDSFPSTTQNGITSVGFNSSFPMSFTLLPESILPDYNEDANDPQWRLLALSITFTTVLSIFTTSAPLFFITIFSSAFFQIALASNPPDGPGLATLVSTALGRFLPAAFIMLLIYHTTIRRTLTSLTAQFEKTVLWLGPFWVGALARYTTERIPIQRLTPHDLRQQPGAIAALVIIVLIIFSAVLVQAWCFRLEGRLLKYLSLYIILGVTLLLLLAIPDLNLRIHHYILALLLLPGTALQTRPSLVFQGLLVGLFVDGVARWGFAPIVETSAALLGDAQLGSILPTLVGAPNVTSSASGNSSLSDVISFAWRVPPPESHYDGVSVLVNDVERFRGFLDDEGVYDQNGVAHWNWTRKHTGQTEFFRFGYLAYGRVQGVRFADYTKAGVWSGDGSWKEMEQGPS